MTPNEIIGLEKFRWIVQESAQETMQEWPGQFFDYAGLIPNNEHTCKYDCTPINTTVFATTGGDGVHYSLLQISALIQPVIMTIPMNFGDSMKYYNWILGEHLNEFLSLGYYNGWFPLEQLCYGKEWVLNFYAGENQEADYQLSGDIQFVKKMRTKLNYKHIPLNNNRLKELEDLYFDQLQFNTAFVDLLKERRN